MEFLYPSSNYNRAAIISQIAVAGRVMMNMVRTEAEDKAQDYILHAPTEVDAASVLRNMLSQLAGIAEPDDGEQFGSLPHVDVVVQAHAALIQTYKKDLREGWDEVFGPQVQQTVGAILVNMTSLSDQPPEEVTAMLRRLVSFCESVPSMSEIAAKLRTVVTGWVSRCCSNQVEQLAKQVLATPSKQLIIQLSQLVATKPEVNAQAKDALAEVFPAILNHVGQSPIDELPAGYITDLKDLNAALVECLKDTKVGAAVETWHGHIVFWESASRNMSCLGAASEEGEVQMVLRELVVSLDKCRKDHLSISFEHDATLGALLTGYGWMVAESWCCNAQVNLASACDKLRTAKAKSLASSTMKLKQICRGSSGGKPWFKGKEGAPWTDVYDATLAKVQKNQLSDLLDAVSKACVLLLSCIVW